MGIDLMASRRRLVMAQPHLASATPANPVAFSATLAAPLKALECAFSPVQAAGTPAPDNVLPISGWTNCNVVRCGKNLFNPANVEMNAEINTSGGTNPTNPTNNWCVTEYIPVKPNTTYTATALHSTGSARYALYDRSKAFVSGGFESVGATAQTVITTGATVAFMRLTVRIGDNFPVMVEEGTATTYAPYTGQTLAVQFPAEAGTIYGGYIDPVRGVARATTERVIMTGVATYPPERSRVSFFGKSAATDRDEYYARLVGARQNSDVSGWYCSAAQVKARADISSPTALTFTQISVGDVNEPRLAFPLSMGIDTVEKANQFLANMLAADTPVVYAYPLATPIEYPLTPAVLKTLKGANVIYTDLNGNVSPTYWTH